MKRLLLSPILLLGAACAPATVLSTPTASCAVLERDCTVRVENYSSREVAIYEGGTLLGSLPRGRIQSFPVVDAAVHDRIALRAESMESEDQHWTVCSRTVRISGERTADFVVEDTCNPRRDVPAPKRPPTAPQTEPVVPRTAPAGGQTTG